MNREERKDMRKRAADRVKKAKAYVLVCFDGVTKPVFSFDLGPCKNEKDLRHVMMRNIADFVAGESAKLEEAALKNLAALETAEKVAEVKEKRSEELSKVEG